MLLTTSNIFFIQHVPSYWVLICGRLAGGMATSILFSAFESWAICEHDKVHQISLLKLIPRIFSTWAVLLLSTACRQCILNHVKCPEIKILPIGLYKFIPREFDDIKTVLLYHYLMCNSRLYCIQTGNRPIRS